MSLNKNHEKVTEVKISNLPIFQTIFNNTVLNRHWARLTKFIKMTIALLVGCNWL